MSLGTIYRSFGFTESCNGVENCGNDLIRETDARGGKTYYDVDEDTSRNEVVTDRCGNKTAYEYDTAGRTTRVISKDPGGTELANVSYAYDAFNNLTEIARGDGMKYVLAYNAFHNLQSIGIEGKTENLVSYVYKNGNGRLKSVTYANGDTMKASYNSVGQMVAEKWYDASGALTAHYKYTYDDQGNIVRSIDMTAGKEYNYTYEEGKLVRAAECGITLGENEVITAKTLTNTIRYAYDAEGTLTQKRIIFADGTEHTVYYETNDGNTVVKFRAGGRTVTSHSKSDSFGRKVFDELQLGTDFVSRQFTYHAGKVTDEHKDNAKVKSSATTQLVSQITFSDGRTLSYAYDAEERIAKITDSIEGVTEYTYDAMGQLLTETVNGDTVNVMEYDKYGNIVSKNGVAYTYGDSVWKDRLTAYGDDPITYDAQGNPVDYLGHTLTWEKGRQLKSFDNIQYTYNANGIQTSKTVNGVEHTYTLDGTKILRETWNGNTLIPLYDNEDSVCGVLYNNTPFYFQKNLQGDVIAIANADGSTVARYSYDAWGKCTVLQDTSGRYIASVNPFRYRGYYYDSEIGMYYLQSRYYDPETGRFINGDDLHFIIVGKTQELNSYSYVKNDPVCLTDSTGNAWYFDVKGYRLVIRVPAEREIDYIRKLVERAVNIIKKGTAKAAETAKKLINQAISAINKKIKTTAIKVKRFVSELINCIKRLVKYAIKTAYIAACITAVLFVAAKDFIISALKAVWNWLNGNKWYQIIIKNIVINLITTLIGALVGKIAGPQGVIGGAIIGLVVGLVISCLWDFLVQGWNS